MIFVFFLALISCVDEIELVPEKDQLQGVAINGSIIKGSVTAVSVLVKPIFTFSADSRAITPVDKVYLKNEKGDQYPIDFTSLLRLAAEVSDAEHGPEELMYQWRTFLHHNDHFHPDPVIFEPESHFLISPLGCGEEIYFYRIELTVTDPEGLATTVSQRIYPYCGTPFTDWLELSGENKDAAIELN